MCFGICLLLCVRCTGLNWTWTGPGLEQTVCVVLYVLRYVLGVLDLDWTRTGADCVCCIICFMLCVRCTGLDLDWTGGGFGVCRRG